MGQHGVGRMILAGHGVVRVDSMYPEEQTDSRWARMAEKQKVNTTWRVRENVESVWAWMAEEMMRMMVWGWKENLIWKPQKVMMRWMWMLMAMKGPLGG